MRCYIDPNKVIWRNIDGEIIILNLDSGHYYTLNKTGSIIWNAFVEKKTPQEVVAKLTDRFKISPKIAKEDVSNLIAMLQKEDLILKKDEDES